MYVPEIQFKIRAHVSPSFFEINEQTGHKFLPETGQQHGPSIFTRLGLGKSDIM